MRPITLESYRNARAEAIEQGLVSLHRGVVEDPERRERFDRTSSVMLEYFLGAGVHRQQANLVDKVTATQVASAFDQEFFIHQQRFDLLDDWVDVSYPQGEDARIFDEPAIFCAFHLNSYRLFWYLLRRRIEGGLFYLLADHVIRDQDPQTSRTLGRLAGSESIRIVPAESPLVLRMACEALGRGDSVLAYVDGNTGVGGKRRFDSRLLAIPFLGGRIRVRQGLAHMAHLSGRALRPVHMAPRPDGGLNLMVHEAIRPGAGEGRTQFAERAMLALYGLLQKEVRALPWSWTEWSTLHISTIADDNAGASDCPDNVDDGRVLTFNHARFELLPYPFGDVLLDKESLRFYPVQQAHRRLLRALYEASDPASVAEINPENCPASLLKIGAIRSSATSRLEIC